MRTNDAVQRMENTLNEIMDNVGEIKHDVGEIKDDVGEIKCLCSPTCIVSPEKTESAPQGTRSSRTFENGFPLRTRP